MQPEYLKTLKQLQSGKGGFRSLKTGLCSVFLWEFSSPQALNRPISLNPFNPSESSSPFSFSRILMDPLPSLSSRILIEDFKILSAYKKAENSSQHLRWISAQRNNSSTSRIQELAEIRTNSNYSPSNYFPNYSPAKISASRENFDSDSRSNYSTNSCQRKKFRQKSNKFSKIFTRMNRKIDDEINRLTKAD